MDFAFSDEQQALAELARTVFADRVTHQRLRELEVAAGEGPVFDRDLWAACAQSGLLGATVPEEQGGAGMGLLELLPVLEAAGEHVAPIPLVESCAVVTAALVAHGAPGLVQRWLAPLAIGEVVLTFAADEGLAGTPGAPCADVRAEAGDGGVSLHGTLPFVAYGQEADRVLLVCQQGDEPIAVLLDPGADGVSAEVLRTTNHQPQAHLDLDGVHVPDQDVVCRGDAALELARLVARIGAAAWAAVQAGVCEGAVRMTATYTSNRRQFDKPIAEFQAVAQRAADAFIDAEMVRLTARHAIYRLSQGLDAEQEVHVAKFWAGDGAMRAVHAAQHLHGGIGVDLDYPLHRYFLWAKRIEHTLGTPTRELIRLGGLLADEPV